MIQKQIYETKARTAIISTLNKNNNIIDKIQFDAQSEYTLARVVVEGDTVPSSVEIQKLNDVLPKDIKKKPTIVQVRFVPVQIIQAGDKQTLNLSDRAAKRLITQ